MHKEIKILPGVEDFLKMLPSILVAEGYKSNFENAINYVEEELRKGKKHVSHFEVSFLYNINEIKIHQSCI